jgi:hypothetical protein
VPSQITKSNSTLTLSTLPQIQIENFDSSGALYQTVLDLDLNSLPTGSSSTSLGFSSLLQGKYSVGGSWDYDGTFISGSISLDTPALTTPLPGTLALFAGGFGLVGYLTRRRKKGTTHSLAAA